MFGREGSVGGSEVLVEAALAVEVVFGKVEVVDDGAVVLAVTHQHGGPGLANMCNSLPAVPALSHGFGGETGLILSAMAEDKVTSNDRKLST